MEKGNRAANIFASLPSAHGMTSKKEEKDDNTTTTTDRKGGEEKATKSSKPTQEYNLSSNLEFQALLEDKEEMEKRIEELIDRVSLIC
jgi:hypothetical protein